jgi:hypothetical protein
VRDLENAHHWAGYPRKKQESKKTHMVNKRAFMANYDRLMMTLDNLSTEPLWLTSRLIKTHKK